LPTPYLHSFPTRRSSDLSQNFSEVLTPYQCEIRWPRGRIFNNLFESVDAELYYSMIRFFRSARIIEVGSGNSTWFAVDALRENRSEEHTSELQSRSDLVC